MNPIKMVGVAKSKRIMREGGTCHALDTLDTCKQGYRIKTSQGGRGGYQKKTRGRVTHLVGIVIVYQ